MACCNLTFDMRGELRTGKHLRGPTSLFSSRSRKTKEPTTIVSLSHRKWCGAKGSNLLCSSWEAQISLTVVSLVWVGALPPRSPQERCSAPNTCHNGVCVVHNDLLCEGKRISDHNREEGNPQPKRNINCHFESRFFPQAHRRVSPSYSQSSSQPITTDYLALLKPHAAFSSRTIIVCVQRDHQSQRRDLE